MLLHRQKSLYRIDTEEKENLKEVLKLGLKAFDGEVSCDEN